MPLWFDGLTTNGEVEPSRSDANFAICSRHSSERSVVFSSLAAGHSRPTRSAPLLLPLWFDKLTTNGGGGLARSNAHFAICSRYSS
ncbi:MAG: hypothetical protein EAZ30_13725 [Betaproteobacteria bacterium]|nr:MAG: hypothetical protein EAZ30_13725 [Betaproteobacteria bacterium]